MSEGGAAIAALTERIKGEIKKYRLIKALKFDISIKSSKWSCRHGHLYLLAK
jgi:hypothetical protein